MNKILIKEKKYEGKYVALDSFSNIKVVSSGNNPINVLEKAKTKGIDNPVIFFVPKNDITYIY